VTGKEALRLLGSPDVRNAILLNEIGVLVHDLGKVSAEFVSDGNAFPHHLILRRLTRGRDPSLGPDLRPLDAVLYALRHCSLSDKERPAAAVLAEKMDSPSRDSPTSMEAVSRRLEAALEDLRCLAAPDQLEAVERVGGLARGVLADWAWQVDEERGLEAIKPTFISADGFYEGLDQLPFVADVVEMQGRTWHSEGLLPPEVRLFRAIHEREEVRGTPRPRCNAEHLTAVRELCCEVLANQLLEINNMKKDGPGDLGSWFWKSPLCGSSEELMALLTGFDQGAELEAEERAAVSWLGVRAIARWALSKIELGTSRGGGETSLWEHCWTLSGLYKSSTAQAIIEGLWPPGRHLSWCTLTVGLAGPDPETLHLVKELVEVEYPLGNELCRSGTEIHFTFPRLERELGRSLLDGLRTEVSRLAGGNERLQLTLGP
jgi:hypothetical protein